MARYAKILVGVDLHHGDRVAARELGPEAKAAIEQAIELAIHAGGQVTFCSSLNVSPQTATLITQDHQNLMKTVEDFAAEVLDQVVADARNRGVSADRAVRFGAPQEELSRLAGEGKYDVIVVGTRARKRAARLLFGSTSQELVRHAPCAVWVVKPEEIREIREIAVATDLTNDNRRVLAAAVEAARALAAKLFIVHAVDISELSYLLMAGISPEEVAQARVRMMEEAEANLQQQLVTTDYRTLPHGVKVDVVEGSFDEAIPKFVTDNEIDILVVGTHGRTGIPRLVLGNSAERVLPLVHCSLIAVKPENFVDPFTSN